MASSAKAVFLLFLLTILSSQQILARDSQFFNKVPSNTNNNAVPEMEPNKQQPLNKPEDEPNFIPETENGGYGLYGHESGQLPPSTTTTTNGEPYKTTTNVPYNSEVRESFPNSKYLPKNYNTEAYVTEAEGYHPTTTTPENNNNNYSPFSIPNSKYLPKNYNTESYVTEAEGYTGPQEYNNNNNYNGEKNGYYNHQQQGYTTGANHGNNYYSNQQQGYTTTSANGNNYNYGANNYNTFAQRGYTATGGSNNYNHYNGGNFNGYQKQGMSDTRFLENGKYFHDISVEKSTFNPNENTRAFGYSNEYNYNGRGGYNGNNGMGGYQNQEQFQNFQDEEDMP